MAPQVEVWTLLLVGRTKRVDVDSAASQKATVNGEPVALTQLDEIDKYPFNRGFVKIAVATI